MMEPVGSAGLIPNTPSRYLCIFLQAKVEEETIFSLAAAFSTSSVRARFGTEEKFEGKEKPSRMDINEKMKMKMA